ncbi:hypothetical protein BH10ACI3_BH10ACI3_03920 [soil metagenome]
MVPETMRELSLNNCRLDKRYDIREQLGRGSYAEVFLALDTLASPQSPHSSVVIKALNVFLQDDLDTDLERTLVENFQNEAIALDRVRHPNIISRIGHGTARDLRGTVFHYLVLEYLAGGDMQRLVRRQKVELVTALSYIEQICAGLGHAHEKGIIHRDIKPQNLLLTADLATVKIADFGVARVSAADSPITRVGTNIYAPPEHSPMNAGQTGTLAFARLTPAADIYSLAKSVYTLTTGEAPRAFSNEPVTELPENVRGEEWADELLRVLQRATSGDQRHRQQTVEAFWSDLAGVRQIAADGEFSTVLRADIAVPQPHVSRGYTPIAPEMPQFESISEPPKRQRPSAVFAPSVMAGYAADRNVYGARPTVATNENYSQPVVNTVASPIVPARKKRRMLRRFVTFLFVIGLFTGILYGTATYMRGRGFLPEIRNPFKTQTGIANTDIYLRPGPSTDGDPIGLVTKNSKVRIVNSQNNWYQVDVVEQGRVRGSTLTATRGWLNGKYLDLGDN